MLTITSFLWDKNNIPDDWQVKTLLQTGEKIKYTELFMHLL